MERGDSCSVVGVGALAGNLVAFERMLERLPVPLPFALVLALDETDSNDVSELPPTSSSTRSIVVAEDAQALVPGTVYVVPRAHQATLSGERIHLCCAGSTCSSSIDALFDSLAHQNQDRARAVLFSGTGSYGIRGLVEIRSKGGVAFFESGQTNSEAPISPEVIASQLANFVGTPEEIADELIRCIDSQPDDSSLRGARETELLAAFESISETLLSAVGTEDVLARLAGDVSAAIGADMCVIVEICGTQYTITHTHNLSDDLVGEPKSADYYPVFSHAAKLRRPVLINDTLNDSRTTKELFTSHGIRALQLIPLLVDDEVMAVIAFAYQSPRHFAHTDFLFAEQLAVAMSAAMRGALLQEAEKSQAALSAVLTEISAVHGSTDEVETALNRALRNAVVPLGAMAVTLAVREGDGWRISQSSRTPEETSESKPRDDAVPGLVDVLKSGERTVVPDVSRETAAHQPTSYAFGYRGYIQEPVTFGDTSAVLTFLFSRSRKAFTEQQLGFTSRLAFTVSAMLENARLLRAQQAEIAHTALMQEIAAVGAGSLELAELSGRALETLQKHLGASEGRISIVYPSAGMVRGITAFGPEGGAAHSRDVALDSDDQRAQVARSNTVALREPSDNGRAMTRPQEAPAETSSATVVIPIRARKTVVGTLELTFPQRDSFAEDELSLLQGVADQVGIAMDKAQLHEKERATSGRMTSIIESITDGFYALDREWRFIFINSEAARMLGKDKSALLGNTAEEVLGQNEWKLFREMYSPTMTAQHAVAAERFIEKTGLWMEAHAFPWSGGVSVYLRDVTQRKLAESERQFTVEFLRLLNESGSTADLVHAAVSFFSDHAGVDAVGVRLFTDGDYPYIETRGFSEEFVLQEDSLFSRCADGSAVLDEAGHPTIECMCGAVILGTTDRGQPFITKSGNFWTGSTTDLLKDMESGPPLARTRKTCNVQGYESVALIALSVGDERLGLIQLNDRRRGKFTFEDIQQWERLAGYMAVALSKLRAEEELAQARQRLEGHIENSPLAVIEFDHGFWIMRWSAEAERMFGWSASEVLGKKISDLRWVHEDDVELVRKVSEGLVDRRAPRYLNVNRNYRKDGSVIYCEWYNSAIYDEEGHLVSVLSQVLDITERRLAEQQVRRQADIEEGTIAILQAALVAQSDSDLGAACLDVAIRVTDSGYGFIGEVGQEGFLQDVAMSQTGWEACSMSSKSGHPRSPGSFGMHGLYGRVINDGVSLMTNDPALHSDSIGLPPGHPEMDAFLGVPLVKGGQTWGLVALAKLEGAYSEDDLHAVEALAPVITEAFQRKRAEQALRESREDLARAQALAHAGSWRLNARTGELTWSEETYRIFGVEQGAPVDYETFLATIQPEDRADASAKWQAAANGEPYDIEHRIIVGSDERWVRELAKLEFDDSGQFLGGVGSVQDITESKKREHAQRMEARQIEVANQLLELFAGETSDDVCEKALQVILDEVGCKYGLFGYIDDSGDLLCPTVLSDSIECAIDEDSKHAAYRRHCGNGLWGRALTDKTTIYSNESADVPTGHVAIRRNLASAIVFQGQSIGLLGIANRDTDYTEEDRVFIEAVSARFAPVLYAWIQKHLLDQERISAEAEREAERLRLRQIIEEIPVGVALVDSEGRVLEINQSTNRIWAGQLPKADSIEGFNVYEGYHHGTHVPLDPSDWPAPRSILTGERVEEIVDILRFDGTLAAVRIESVPVANQEGATGSVVVLTEDVTQRLQRERLKESSAVIGAYAGSTFDKNEILHRVLVESTLALEVESSALISFSNGEWDIQESVGETELALKINNLQNAADHSLMEGHEPIVLDGTDDRHLLDHEIVRRVGVKTLLLVPLYRKRGLVALLAFQRGSGEVDFTPPEVEFASEIIDMAALALENAALYERERSIADTLQEAILVPPDPIPDLELSYLYRPASSAAYVGGDFYDVFKIDQTHTGILIGDVSGKGLEAARHTTLFRSGVRAYALEDRTPDSVMTHLNLLALHSTPVEAYATVFFGVLERFSGKFEYCGAGHPAGLVLRPGGIEVLKSCSSIVGAFEDAGFVSDQTVLGPGDVLVLFTDGVLEARQGGELFGVERTVRAVAGLHRVPLVDMPDHLLSQVTEFAGGTLRDDIVVMCLRRPAALPL